MKKLFAWSMAALLLVSIAALPGYGQSAQEVLKKMIDAQGGRKVLEAIKDTTSTGTLELTAMGMSGTFTEYMKEPNKVRMDIEVMGQVITRAYDGQKAWGTNMQTGAVEESPEPQAKEMSREAIRYDGLLNPQKYGITYAVKPKVKLEDKEYIVLEQTNADGHKTTMYLDPATYLQYKVETMAIGATGTDAKVESYPSDYRKVGQAMVPHAIRQVMDGTDYLKITFTKITFNNNLEDTLFAMNK